MILKHSSCLHPSCKEYPSQPDSSELASMLRIPHVRVSSAPAGKVSSTDCLSPAWFSDPGTSPSSEVAVPWITDVNEVDAACEAFAALIVNRTRSGSVFANQKRMRQSQTSQTMWMWRTLGPRYRVPCGLRFESILYGSILHLTTVTATNRQRAQRSEDSRTGGPFSAML